MIDGLKFVVPGAALKSHFYERSEFYSEMAKRSGHTEDVTLRSDLKATKQSETQMQVLAAKNYLRLADMTREEDNYLLSIQELQHIEYLPSA